MQGLWKFPSWKLKHAELMHVSFLFLYKWPWTVYLVSAVDPDRDLDSPVLELRTDEVVVPLGGVDVENFKPCWNFLN